VSNFQTQSRQLAWQIMKAALEAVNPATAVHNYFKDHQEIAAQVMRASGRVIVVGAGKAGAPMAQAVSEIFGDKIADGQVIVKYGHTLEKFGPSAIQIREAGHPVPDEAGLVGAREIAQLLNRTTENDVVLCLISGGGSALLTLPAEGLELSDLQATTSSLLAAGATINQINTIRKHLSAVKGGRLAEMAAPATVYTFILSDVVGDPLEVIASGPTVPDPTTFQDAWNIVKQFELQSALPEKVVRRLQAGCADEISDTPKPGAPIFARVHNAVIGSNRIAARAAVEAARKASFESCLLTTFVEGEACEVARVIAGLAKGLISNEGPLKCPACLVLGGETTVTLKGDGKGGRNQEMALAAGIALQGWPNTLIACLGTDGTDGPTDAAGAFADGTTVERGRSAGMEAAEYLNRNDAYHFLAGVEDLILTGPTRTNVNDLIFIFAW
jgi:hydroxypyruvate reductase